MLSVFLKDRAPQTILGASQTGLETKCSHSSEKNKNTEQRDTCGAGRFPSQRFKCTRKEHRIVPTIISQTAPKAKGIAHRMQSKQVENETLEHGQLMSGVSP